MINMGAKDVGYAVRMIMAYPTINSNNYKMYAEIFLLAQDMKFSLSSALYVDPDNAAQHSSQ